MKITIDGSKCISCQQCTDVCDQGIFKKTESGVASVVIERSDYCIQCGMCMLFCVPHAIDVENLSYGEKGKHVKIG